MAFFVFLREVLFNLCLRIIRKSCIYLFAIFWRSVIDWAQPEYLYNRFRFGAAAKLRFRGNRPESECFLFFSCIVEIDKVAPGTYQGIITMKKYILSAALAIASLTFGGICAATSAAEPAQEKVTTEQCHTHAEGQHCRGSVGCDCRGFSPITNGKEWQKEYCRHCGHKKSYHR